MPQTPPPDLDALLGPARDVTLPQGTIRVRERGAGDPVLFVHGFLVDGSLWRNVVPAVADAGHRCIVPDLPFGSHTTPMPAGTDFSPPAMARLLADLLAALDLDSVTVVANDTGGAITQIMLANHPERISRLVLTNCDAYENFLPPMFRPLQWISYVPGGVAAALAPMRSRRLRRLPTAYGLVTHRAVPDAITDRWVGPVLRDPAIRRDMVAFLRGPNKRYTLAAAQRFGSFQGPVLIAWGVDDRIFSLRWAQRLAGDFPRARVVRIEDSRTFVMEDQPERVAREIVSFLAEGEQGGGPNGIARAAGARDADAHDAADTAGRG